MSDKRKWSAPGKSPAHLKRQLAKTGAVAQREMLKSQKETNLLIPAAAFERLARYIAQDIKYDSRFQSDAFKALQHASDAYLIELFERETRAARHAGRTTFQGEDIFFLHDLCDK